MIDIGTHFGAKPIWFESLGVISTVCLYFVEKYQNLMNKIRTRSILAHMKYGPEYKYAFMA